MGVLGSAVGLAGARLAGVAAAEIGGAVGAAVFAVVGTALVVEDAGDLTAAAAAAAAVLVAALVLAFDFAAMLFFFSSYCRRAFSMIASCLLGSLARIGTKSSGTGVPSLKFCENFMSSFNLIVRS